MGNEGQLRCVMNMMALNSLPEWSVGYRPTAKERFEMVKASGFDGIQFAEIATDEELALCRFMQLDVYGSGRVSDPKEAGAVSEQFADKGYKCATLHVGWGLEDDDEACRLVEHVFAASQRWRIPLFFETHRATICQDMWRTVQLVRRFPEMRFNADFSHWYAGQEMVYGGFESKLNFIRPVIERVAFLHGRIASPGCIQVPILEGAIYTKHFEKLWSESFRAFRQNEEGRSEIYFAPELLAPDIYYARAFHGREESDRWTESLGLKQMAERCFACAN